MTQTGRRFFDVISHLSNSYFTDKHEILVPVGQGDAELPPVPTKVTRLDLAPSQEEAGVRPDVGPSQEVAGAPGTGDVPRVPSGVPGVPSVCLVV